MIFGVVVATPLTPPAVALDKSDRGAGYCITIITGCHSVHRIIDSVEIGLSDMHFLRLRVRQSILSADPLHSEFDLPYLTLPACRSLINRPDMYFCSHLFSIVFHIVSYSFFTADICCHPTARPPETK